VIPLPQEFLLPERSGGVRPPPPKMQPTTSPRPPCARRRGTRTPKHSRSPTATAAAAAPHPPRAAAQFFFELAVPLPNFLFGGAKNYAKNDLVFPPEKPLRFFEKLARPNFWHAPARFF